MAVVLPPINEVIDLHSVHLVMARRHLPTPIMTLLLGTAAIGLGMVGSVMGVWDAGFLCSTPFTVPFLRSLCG